MDLSFFQSGVLLWWHWVVLGLMLIILEIFMPGVFLLWIGIGALATGGLSVLAGIESWEMQCLIFVPLAFGSLFLGWRCSRKAGAGHAATLNQRTASYVGRKAHVVEAIVNGAGRVRLGDTVWTAQGDDCPAGTAVTITGSEGSVLFVRAQTPSPSHERNSAA